MKIQITNPKLKAALKFFACFILVACSFMFATITLYQFIRTIYTAEFIDCIITMSLLMLNVIYDIEAYDNIKNKIFI